jgi:hypothetical protein
MKYLYGNNIYIHARTHKHTYTHKRTQTDDAIKDIVWRRALEIFTRELPTFFTLWELWDGVLTPALTRGDLYWMIQVVHVDSMGLGHARCDPQYAILKWTFIHFYKDGSSFKNMTQDTVPNFYTKRVPMRQIFNKVQGTVIRDPTRWFWKMRVNHWSRTICLINVEADSTLWYRN